MANFSPSLSVDPSATKDTNHFSALVLISFLFFMWGLLTSLNDVLIPHLKVACKLPAACYLYILYYGFKYRNLSN